MLSSRTAAVIAVLLASCVLVHAPMPSFAQEKAAPKGAAKSAKSAAPQPQQPEPPKEVALTEKDVDGVVASQPDMAAIVKSLPKARNAKPDPKIEARFEEAAKKHGFASFDAYNAVVASVGAVLAGVDPKTKTYVGFEAVLKQQIEAAQADKAIPAKDKKEILADLNGALKQPAPPKPSQANIDLVTKNFDRLSAAVQAL